MTVFSINLKFLRKERKLSQRQIAESIGITQTTYSDYERGRSEPTIGVLVKLADFFGKSLDMIVRVNLPSIKDSY